MVIAPEKMRLPGKIIVPPLVTVLLEGAKEFTLAMRSEPPVMERPPLVFAPEMILLPAALMRIPAPEMAPEREMMEFAEPVSVRLVPEMVTKPVLEIFWLVASRVPVEEARTSIPLARLRVTAPTGANVPPWNCKVFPPVTRVSDAAMVVLIVVGATGLRDSVTARCSPFARLELPKRSDPSPETPAA